MPNVRIRKKNNKDKTEINKVKKSKNISKVQKLVL